MGNHQFGFNSSGDRPPEFFGKRWLQFSREKKSESEKRCSGRLLNRNLTVDYGLRQAPSRTSSFRSYLGGGAAAAAPIAKFQEEEEEVATQQADRNRIQSDMFNSAAPQPKNRNSNMVRRSRSMRCSPTVPDSMTLTLGLVNNVVVGAGGIAAAAAGPPSSNAVASALDALNRLTPAAPRLFKEPSFDDFFEEAERRNQTMQVLQAALGTRSHSTASIGGRATPTGALTPTKAERHSPFISTDHLPIGQGSSTESAEYHPIGRVSPIIVQPPTPPPIRKSPIRTTAAAIRKDSKNESPNYWPNPSRDDGEGDPLLGNINNNDNTDNDRFPNQGRVLVIVGGCSEAESSDGDRWDKSPPTIIVQPEQTGQSLFSQANNNSASCLPSLSDGSSGGGGSPRRYASSPTGGSPGTLLNPACLAVRFADELLLPPPLVNSVADENESCKETREYEKAAQRVKRRSSLRRKTIGVVTNLNRSPETRKPDLAGYSRALGDASSSAVSALSLVQVSSQRRAVTKKGPSKSDLLYSQPIISLLTPAQIVLIRNVWQQIYVSKGPAVLGSHIFHRLMFKDPRIREVFRIVDIGNRCFNVDFMCKKHAKSVATMLNELVKNLDNLGAVENLLMDVGRQHAVFHDLGFRHNFWSIFAEAFIDCTLEWGEKNRRVEEARKAWAIIISYAADKLKMGYQEERRNTPRCPTGRRIRVVSETEIRAPTTDDDTIPKMALIRSDSH